MNSINTILVTGGAGFIGSSLIDKLIDIYPNSNILNIDNFCDFYDPKIKEKNLSKHLKFSNYHLYRIDIENIDELEKVFSNNPIDIVIHLAARAGVRPSLENPTAYVKTNILGTCNILECMKKYKIKRLIFASSSSVYGNNKADIFSENLKLNKPISPYAATKLTCEHLIYTYSRLYSIRSVVLRFFTVYGPRQRPDLAINKFVKLIKNDLPIEVYGDGSSKRDYTYISDIIDGILSAMHYKKSLYEIINLGNGNPITLNDMISTLELILHKKARLIYKPNQPGDADRTNADINKANKLLTYKPKISFKDGINNFIISELANEKIY